MAASNQTYIKPVRELEGILSIWYVIMEQSNSVVGVK